MADCHIMGPWETMYCSSVIENRRAPSESQPVIQAVCLKRLERRLG
jgi:hypothetical protein